MSKTWVTRCPECQTSFRLTRAQLQAANGSVRCGSCLHVFKATHHIIPQQDGAPPPGPVKQAPAPVTPESPSVSANTAPPSAAVERPRPVEQPQKESPALELSDDFESLDTWSPEATSNFNPNLDRVDAYDAADESWATQMLEELEKEEYPSAKSKTQKPTKKARSSANSSMADSDDSELGSDPDFSALDASTELAPQQTADNSDTDSFGGMRAERRTLDELKTEPLNLYLPESANWWKTLFYSVASLLAALLLLLQYAWFDRDNLARQDKLRPYYQMACEHLQCSLPDKINIQAIRGSNLVVRSHPRFENALIVDAIINNQASYGQPFPAIQLTFSDLSGTIVASRRFKPDEYLSGELAGAREMPSHTPIHLTLEINDPGQKAVNYNLAFYPQL